MHFLASEYLVRPDRHVLHTKCTAAVTTLHATKRCSQVVFLVLLLGNSVLRKIFKPETGEVTGGWKKFNNVELQHVYSSPNVIRAMK
jgi:hypothetical protein